MNSAPPARPQDDAATIGNWQHALRDTVRSVGEMLELLELGTADLEWAEPALREFPLRVPRGYVARMRRGDPHDPLLRQVLPLKAERLESPGFSADPLREVPLARSGLLEKYPARVLIVTTPVCPVHCRYCFRRHYPYESHSLSRGDLGRMIRDLGQRPDVREVILSGGDPLSLSNGRLNEIVSALAEARSVATLRIHTRYPIVLPERVDDELADLVERSGLKVVVVTHCNHANEIDPDVVAAVARLSRAGAMLLNQSVLLRGVNDSVEALEALSYGLFDAGVLPYYLHQLDRVSGTAHFEVCDADATALISELRRRVPGYLVPRLVREEPGELSKTPLGESHL